MRALLSLGSLVVGLAVDLPAVAQQPAAAPTPPAASAAARRDPKGLKGISPFWEAVKKGDSAYVARDFDAAITAYREAITAEPQNPMGHYRLGEAQLAKGDTDEAQKSWDAGIRFAGKNTGLQAKLLFLIADLSERKRDLKKALDDWKAYLTFVQQHTDIKGFAGTAAERQKRIDDWQKLVEEYAAVKERIQKRLEEADKKARENAK
jgi:tetratricopeptide (TPR) repeat protein